MRALQTWLASRHLDVVVLEILNSKTDAIIGRWDIDVVYTTGSGDGGFWTDKDQIRHHVRKAGLAPSEARYRLLLQVRPGSPDVDCWGDAEYRSTNSSAARSVGKEWFSKCSSRW